MSAKSSNSTNILNFYTRGGQIALHTLHMFKQICLATLSFSVAVSVLVFAVLFFSQTTAYQLYLYKEVLYAEFSVNMSQNDPSKITQEFRYEDGTERLVKSEHILKNPHIKAHIDYVDRIARENLWKSIKIGFISMILSMGFFIYGGYLKSRKKLERGNQLSSTHQLKRILKNANQESDLHLDQLPLSRDKETSHILITGTTSSGKTNCFHTLLPQIRNRAKRWSRDRAIIVDMTGDFISKYYREGQDLLLNPFDKRSEAWSPWEECLRDTHYDALAAALVPKSETHDKFWENAGKALFSSALRQLRKQGETDIQKLYYILVRSHLNDFSKFFQETDAASYTHTDGEKMTLSIRATLANHLQCLKFLKPTDEGFSIRKWVKDEHKDWDASRDSSPWLFLSARPDQRETLLPLLSAWLDTAINALMSLSPDINRRLWFVIDELPSLQKLPSLEIAMAESRKYGGCVLAGVQSFPQLTATYGLHQAQSLLDLFNTKIFFRNTAPNTTQWISKVLGEVEITEQQETLSYGAHSMRDGVSLSPQNRTKSLVLPTEIANLQDLEAFIKLPGSIPPCKLTMTYKKIHSITLPFKPLSDHEMKKREEGFDKIKSQDFIIGAES